MTAILPDAPLDLDLEIKGTMEQCGHWRRAKANAVVTRDGADLDTANASLAFYEDQLGKLMLERARRMQAEETA